MINEATLDSTVLSPSLENNTELVPLLEGKLRYELEHTLLGMYRLFEEIKEKRAFIQEKSGSLQAIIDELKQKNIIKAAEALEKGLQKSLTDYYALSDMLTNEIISHVGYYNRYLNPAPESTNDEPAKSSEQLSPLRPISALPQEIKLLNSYVKNRKKDLSIIFSRYDHGLTTRLRNFESLQTSAVSHPK